MKTNYNSSENQRIKGMLVSREICHCASQMISELQRSSDFNDEILELFYSIPDYDQALEDYLYYKSEEEISEILEHYGVNEVAELSPDEVVNDYNLDFDYLEPYEFWIISDWFGEKLKEHDQIVCEFMGFTIWGRLTTGQAILLDHVISMIAEEMEILDGMKHSWSK
jgi:hypothetical protein